MEKADLHRHLLGSVTPHMFVDARDRYIDEMAPRLSKRRAKSLLVVNSPVNGLEPFFRPWRLLCSILVSPDVIRRWIVGALAIAKSDNVTYTEFRAGWGMTGTEPFGIVDFLHACRAGIHEAQDLHGVNARIILSVTRHLFDRHNAQRRCSLWAEILSAAVQFRDIVVGFDLSGVEIGHPARDFAPEFKAARGAGFKITVHCGEVCGPDSIWEALEFLCPDRLGHAISCVRDPALMQHLAESGIPVEVCPTVNRLTKAYPTESMHPVVEMYRAGVNITIGTDNPAICETSLTRELIILNQSYDFSDRDIEVIVANGFSSAFSSPLSRKPPARVENLTDPLVSVA